MTYIQYTLKAIPKTGKEYDVILTSSPARARQFLSLLSANPNYTSVSCNPEIETNGK